jgi:penicillin-binding protein 1A
MNNKKNTHKNTKKKKKKTGLKIFKITLLTILILCITAGVAVCGIVLGMVKTAPPLDVDQVLSLNEPTTFYDDKGNLNDEYLTVEKRDIVSLDEIPANLRKAFIDIEDERFMDHHGIDYRGLAGAFVTNVKHLIAGKGSLYGASTITQQLIKQRFFLQDSLTNRMNIERKVQQMYLALELEKVLSKEKILEAYLNTIPLGSTAHGVKVAAEQYFNKDLDKLTLTECAFLASAAQNPTVSYSVALKIAEDKESIITPRTKAVLEKMLENQSISSEQFNNAMKNEVEFNFSKKKKENTMNYEWFNRPVIEAVKKDLMKKYNKTEEEINNMLSYGGLKIYTTMNTELQNKTQAILDDKKDSERTKAWQYIFPRDNDLNPLQPDLQASAVVMDYHNGEVKVIIGGRGEQEALSYNRAASDKFLRAPGSCIKPLTVYAPAIDTKIATASTVFEDSPLSTETSKKYTPPGVQLYNPRNAPNRYEGYLPMRQGLKYSKNVVAIKVLDTIGLQTGASYGEKFGLQLDSRDKQSIAALALGQLDSGDYLGTNPLTLAAAYGTFGNNGMLTEPRLYTKVLDRNGKILLQTKPEGRQVISPQTAYIMYDLLKEPVTPDGDSVRPHSTGTKARIQGMSVRGKTGTSSDGKNYLFTGLTPYYSASVWVGNDDYSKIKGSFYSNNAAGVWSKIMTEFHKGLKDKKIEEPAGITRVQVCKDSGNLPSDISNKDPRGNRIYTELFIEGTAPTSFDRIHVMKEVVKKDDGSYVLATELSDPRKIEQRVFITRDYTPKVTLADQKYIVPTETDETLPFDDILDDLNNSDDSNNLNGFDDLDELLDLDDSDDSIEKPNDSNNTNNTGNVDTNNSGNIGNTKNTNTNNSNSTNNTTNSFQSNNRRKKH